MEESSVETVQVPCGWPMSVSDVERIGQFVKKHEKIQRCYRLDGLVDRLFAIVQHYEQTAINSLESQKKFRDEETTYLRALAMILEMVGNAGTHREKAARLRGCVEMIETGIEKLQKQTFDIATQWNWMPDIFRSDFSDTPLYGQDQRSGASDRKTHRQITARATASRSYDGER